MKIGLPVVSLFLSSEFSLRRVTRKNFLKLSCSAASWEATDWAVWKVRSSGPRGKTETEKGQRAAERETRIINQNDSDIEKS